MKLSRLQKILFVFLFFFGLSVFLSPPLWAAFRHHSGATYEQKRHVLGRAQALKIIKKLTKEILANDLFTKSELSQKLMLSCIQIQGENLGVSESEYTDIVLNDLLENTKVLVVNQDITTDLKLDYKLMGYWNETDARRKGILLGADYIVTGTLTANTRSPKPGQVQSYYVGTLALRDIHSDQLIVQTTYDTSTDKKHKRYSH